MDLFYRILADIILVVHIGYVSYVVFGQLAILIGWPLRWKWIRNPWFRITHLTMILIVAYEAYFGILCPLTTWERQLRNEVDDGSSFMAKLHEALTIDPTTFNWICIALGGVVVAMIFLAPPRFRRSAPPSPPEPAPIPPTGIPATPPDPFRSA